MGRFTRMTSGLAALALGAAIVGALPAAAEGPDDLNAMRARFENMPKTQVAAAGYAPDVVCVGTPGGMMGWHAEKYPFNEDNTVDAANPEILLLDESGKVMGLEYETYDVSVPAPSLFGHSFVRTEGHPGKQWPHYMLHIHFLPNGGYFIGDFNPNRRCPAPPVAKVAAAAIVTLKDGSGATVGLGRLSEDPSGYVQIDVELTGGLRPGAHGFHIHAVGKCEGPAFTSAGGHFNPLNRQHGVRNPQGPHAGDLQSLIVHRDGKAHIRLVSNKFTLSAGPASLFDADGSALVVHADDDDHMSDPTGNAGARAACSVIERASAGEPVAPAAPAALPRTGEPLPLNTPLALLTGLTAVVAGYALRRLRA